MTNRTIHRSTYFKADYLIVQKTENIEHLANSWKTPIDSTDKFVRFKIAKQRFRAKYIALQKANRDSRQKFTSLKNELDALKHSIQNRPTEIEIQSLDSITLQLRELEFKQAIKWKQRTRLKWLGLGDASTKYFFNSVKQKHKREAMTELILDSEEHITDERRILEELHRYYTAL
jgi:hypothetical protein